MGKIQMCPACTNKKSGDMVIRCGNCGLVQCENCATSISILMRRYKCPRCGTPWRGSGINHQIFGEIE